MGCGVSTEGEIDKNGVQRSKQIDHDIRKQGHQWRTELKILLLGIGESGKSTIAKQMRILYLNGFPEAERKQFIPIVHANILSSMKILCLATTHMDLGSLVRPENKRSLIEYQNIEAYRTKLDLGHASCVKELWSDPGIRAAYERQSEFFLPGCCAYFFEAMDRIVGDDYVPNLEDILRCRVKTT